MKVLFVYRYLTLGGCESVLRARLDELPAHGVTAEAWFLEDGEGRGIFEGVAGRWSVGSIDELRTSVEAGAFDVVSCLDTPEAFPPLAGFGSSRPLVVEVHSPYPETRRYLDTISQVPVSAFFVPSEFQARIVRARVGGRAPVRVVPNSLRRMFASAPAPARSTSRPVVVWVGRVDRQKNWAEFVEIAREVSGARGDVEFWMVGSAWRAGEADALRQAAAAAGILGSLRWFASVDHSRIAGLFDAARASGGVAISTSGAESFGMTIAEAMARGCAVVAPAFGPFAEFVDPGRSGELYALGNPREAAGTVLALLDDAPGRDRLGNAAREEILARFAPAVAASALARELRRLVG
jgi:glycosyltransferase involved in cell wall biosynthesis